MDSKSKKKQGSPIQSVLLNPLPATTTPQAYFGIPKPFPYQFPLSEYCIEGLKLLQYCMLTSQNELIKKQFKNQRVIGINKHKDYLCMLGHGGNGLLIHNVFIDTKGITAYTYWPNLLIIAYDDLRLQIYSIELGQIQQLKVFNNFTQTKINFIKIISIPQEYQEYQDILLLVCTQVNVAIYIVQKSIFYKLVSKLYKNIIQVLEYPITQIAQIPFHLQPQLYKYNGYQDSSLISLTTINIVYILKIDYQKLYQDDLVTIDYKKQYINDKITMNTSSWGLDHVQFAQKGQKYDVLVLLYSFNSDVYELALRKKENGKCDWVQSYPLKVQQGNVVFCQFMKRSQLLLITDDNRVIVFHTSQYSIFEEMTSTINLQKLVERFPGVLQAIRIGSKVKEKQSQEIGFEELTEEQLKKINQIPVLSYSNTFVYDNIKNQIYIMTEKRITGFQYCNWNLISKQLISTNKFESAMLFLISIYKKCNKFQLDVKNDQQNISECIHVLCKEFINRKLCLIKNNVEEINSENSYYLKIIAIPIELLVETEEFDYLFETAKPEIISALTRDDSPESLKKSTSLFYSVLQKFIEYGKLTYIPDEYLKNVLQYYSKQKKYDIINRLSIFINVKKIEKSILIHNLIQNNLVVSLAHVCIQGDQNQFLIPFVKLFGFCTHYYVQENYQYAEIYAVRVIWYVQICLQRNWILKQYSNQKYAEMVLLLTESFLKQNVITKLLEIRTEYCLQTLSYYFTIQNYQIVNQINMVQLGLDEVQVADWISHSQNFSILQVILSAIEQYLQSAIKQVKERNIKQLKGKKLDVIFNLFLGTLTISKTIKFKYEKYHKILISLIQNYTMLKQTNYGLEEKIVKQYKQKNSQNGFEMIDNILSARYINKLLTLVYYQYPDIMNKNFVVLLNAAGTYKLFDVQAEIYFLQNRYEKCIDTYKFAPNQFYKNLIFEFLENALKKLTTEQRRNDKAKFTKCITKNLQWMVSLNPQNTILIIQNFIQEIQNNLIQALSGKQILQLQFLQYVISNENIMKQSLNQKSIQRYIQLMAKFKKQQLIISLKNNPKFIHQETLRICQQYKAYDCMEYLYQKIGNIASSVKICALRVEELITQYKAQEQTPSNTLSSSESIKTPYQSLELKIKQLLKNVIDICQKNNSQQIWQALLDSCIELYKKYKDNKQYKQQQKLFLYINGEITHHLIASCSIQFVIDLIQNKFKELSMGEHMTISLKNSLNNFTYSIDIYHLANRLAINSYKQSEKLTYQSKLHSFSGSLACQTCKAHIFGKQKSIHFMCGHAYHIKCLGCKDPIICLSCLTRQGEQFKYYLSSIINTESLKIKKICQVIQRFKSKDLQIKEVNKFQERDRNKDIQECNAREVKKQNMKKLKNFENWVDENQESNRRIFDILGGL